MHELTVDVNDQVAVSFVELLQHFKLSFCHSERSEEPLMRQRNHANNLTNQTDTVDHVHQKSTSKSSMYCEIPRRLRGLGMTADLPQSILIKSLIALAAALVSLAEAHWHLIARRTIRLE